MSILMDLWHHNCEHFRAIRVNSYVFLLHVGRRSWWKRVGRQLQGEEYTIVSVRGSKLVLPRGSSNMWDWGVTKPSKASKRVLFPVEWHCRADSTNSTKKDKCGRCWSHRKVDSMRRSAWFATTWFVGHAAEISNKLWRGQREELRCQGGRVRQESDV